MSETARRLRVESDNGSPAREYRIAGDKVEVRTLDPASGLDDGAENLWWRLTPQQLSTHVERNTIVAQWLERRLGWRQLLRACVGEALFQHPTASGLDHSSAQ